MVAIYITVKNLDKSIKFYKEVLGYREETLVIDLIKLASGSEAIYLQEDRLFEKNHPVLKGELKNQRGVGAIISLHVTDVNESYSKVESYGGKNIEPVKSTPSGDVIFFCKDPDGYLLRLHSHGGTSHSHDRST